MMEKGISDKNLLIELKNNIFPDVIVPVGGSVRLRTKPVMSKVKKLHAPAYILAHSSRTFSNSLQESPKFDKIVSKLHQQLPLLEQFPSDNFGYCSFDAVQRQGMQCLKNALDNLIASSDDQTKIASSSQPRINRVSISSVLNRRRRQEDRWFVVPDLVAYAPFASDDKRVRRSDYPQILGCGVFDGHGGPEAAEHCSNLAPFLLSRRLQRRFLETEKRLRSTETIPDILANVIHELTFSVGECHQEKLWSSGTTATICLVYGDFIYTAWVGDSQAVVFSYDGSSQHVPVEEVTNLNLHIPQSPECGSPCPSDITPTLPFGIDAQASKLDKHQFKSPPVSTDGVDVSVLKQQMPHSSTIPIEKISPRSSYTNKFLQLFSREKVLEHDSVNLNQKLEPKLFSAREQQLTAVRPQQIVQRTPISLEDRPDFLEPLVDEEHFKPAHVASSNSSVRVDQKIELPFSYRCGSLPTRKPEKPLCEGGVGDIVVVPGSLAQSKRQSTHFSEPALQNLLDGNIGGGGSGGDLNVSLSAGASQHISPAGDLRSRSTSMAERPSFGATFQILTDRLHRPERAPEFISVLRSGGCITFKSEEYASPSSDEEATNTLTANCPPLMTNNSLLVPNLSVPGTYRVGGISGVARSIGIDSASVRGMSSLPSVGASRLPSSPCCLILGSDGLWDTFSCAPTDLMHFFAGTPCREFAKLLTARAVRNGSSDNVTVLVIWIRKTDSESCIGLEREHSPCLYPLSTRSASVPHLCAHRLRGPIPLEGGRLNSAASESSLLAYIEPIDRLPSRIHSLQVDTEAESRFRFSSPMHIRPAILSHTP